MSDLEGRTALVTGASGAIGRACAVALATQGARIVVAYGSDEQGAQETADLVKAAGAEPVVAQADLTDPGRPGRWWRRPATLGSTSWSTTPG